MGKAFPDSERPSASQLRLLLSEVRRAAQQKRDAEARLKAAAVLAREHGAYWAEIGDAAGCDRLTARTLTTRRLPDLRNPANLAKWQAAMDAKMRAL